MDTVAVDRRREVQADTEFLELDGDGEVGTGPLRDGNRKLTTGEEARFLATLRNQVRLGKALEQAALLHRTDQYADVVLLAEEEQVQEVAEIDLARCARHRRAEVAAFLRPGELAIRRSRNLRRGNSAEGVLTPVGLVKNVAPSSLIALRLTS